MPGFRDTFDDRRNRALEAKKAQVAAFAARPGPDDPKVREREEARKVALLVGQLAGDLQLMVVGVRQIDSGQHRPGVFLDAGAH